MQEESADASENERKQGGRRHLLPIDAPEKSHEEYYNTAILKTHGRCSVGGCRDTFVVIDERTALLRVFLAGLDREARF